MLPAEQAEKLCGVEMDYLNKYNDLMDAYQTEWFKGLNPIDLTLEQHITEEPYAYVRILEGEVLIILFRIAVTIFSLAFCLYIVFVGLAWFSRMFSVFV